MLTESEHWISCTAKAKHITIVLEGIHSSSNGWHINAAGILIFNVENIYFCFLNDCLLSFSISFGIFDTQKKTPMNFLILYKNMS